MFFPIWGLFKIKKCKHNDICVKKNRPIEYYTQRNWDSIMDVCTGAPIDEVTVLSNRFAYDSKFDYLDTLLFGVTFALLSKTKP